MSNDIIFNRAELFHRVGCNREIPAEIILLIIPDFRFWGLYPKAKAL